MARTRVNLSKSIISFVFILFCLISVNNLYASHMMGVDLTYRPVDAPAGIYELTLKFTANCDGTPVNPQENINVFSATCGQFFVAPLPLQPCPGGNCEVSQLCSAQLPQSSCSGGALPGVEQYVYQGTITLPMSCADWQFSFSSCCRGPQVSNITCNPYYIDATLNNILGDNQTAVSTDISAQFICTNQPFTFDPGFIDPDGDSLAISLVAPQAGPGNPCGYVGGLSPTNFLNTSSGVTLDPLTGIISFTSNMDQFAVFSYLVEEYRNGVLIGTSTRDMQIISATIPGCTGNNDTFNISPIFNASGINNFLAPYSLEACVNSTIVFDIGFGVTGRPNTEVILDPSVFFYPPGAILDTIFLFDSLGGQRTDTVIGRFSWTPTISDVGFHNFTVTIKDDGCPILGSQIFNFDITVVPTTEVTPDSATYTPTGSPIQLNATGGTNFTWSPTTGLSSATGASVTAAPPGPPPPFIDYTVTSDLTNGCPNTDTVRIFIQAACVPIGDTFSFDLCPGDTLLFRGDTFTVSGTFIDTVVNVSGCDSLVTINVVFQDTIPPVISCPADISVNVNPGVCDTILNYSIGATDNCPSGSPIPTNILAPGDIAFTGFNADNPDEFSFVVLTEIAAGTQINFTDNGWFATGGFRANEGTYTYTAPTNLSPGAEVNITTSGLFLSTSGDQILAYQGPASSPRFITAIHFNGNSGWETTATSSNTSALPRGLVNGVTAFSINELDNASYNCAVTTGIDTIILIDIYTATNWTGSNTTRRSLPPNCGFNITNSSSLNLFLNVFLSDGFGPGTPFPLGNSIETWVAIDGAGNSDTCGFTVTVQDSTQLTITCPNDSVLQCNPPVFSIPPANALNIQTSKDCPSTSIISLGDLVTTLPSCLTTLERTYQATDAFGNTAQCTRVISWLSDPNPPFIVSGPADITLACPSDPIPAPDTTGFFVVEICSFGFSINHISDVSNGGTGANGDPEIITRTYEVQDSCGNISPYTQLITREDVLAPTVSCQDVTVTPIVSVTITSNDVVSATSDNCGTPSISLSQSVFSCASLGVFSITVTADDGNGNTASCSANVTVDSTNCSNCVDVFNNISASICQGESFSFGGQNLTLAGTYSDTIAKGDGCDSIVILALTVLPNAATSISQTICNNQSFNFGGQVLAAPGVYTDTLVAANGCDSVVTLTLIVLPTTTGTINAGICAGQSFNFNGNIISAPGVYNDTLAGSNGCDSVVTLTLILLPNAATSISQTICDNQSFTFGGQVLTAPGVYEDTLVATNGCDSVVTLTLIVVPTTSGSVSFDICTGDSITVNGVTYTTAGSFTQTLVNVFGCDSTLTVNINVLSGGFGSLIAEICPGDTLTVNGIDYTTNGTFNQTLTATNGCDSNVVIQVNFLPVSNGSITIDLCQGDTITINGIDYSMAGTFTQTLTSSLGCDSTVTITINELLVTSGSLSVDICQGDAVTINGATFNTAGTFVQTLVNQFGCDSTLTITINVLQVLTTNISATICPGDSFSFGGNDLTLSGTYADTLLSNNGCDSIIILSLLVADSIPPSATCPSDTFLGCNPTAAQIPAANTGSVSTSDNCGIASVFHVSDIINTLPGCVTVLQRTYQVTDVGGNIAVCMQDISWISDPNAPVVISGPADTTLQCTDPIPSPDLNGFTVVELCAGGVFNVSFVSDVSNGGTGQAGNPLIIDRTFSITDSCGNTATYVQQITIDCDTCSDVTNNISVTICQGDSFSFGGNILNTTGTYFDTIAKGDGCDSIVVLQLNVNQITADFTATPTSGCSLPHTVLFTDLSTSSAVIASYLWNFGDGGISAVANPVHVYTNTGLYTVSLTVTDINSCSHTLARTDYISVGLTSFDTLNFDICQGDDVTVNGTTYNTSGTFNQTLGGFAGCDSNLVINVNVILNVFTTLFDTINNGDTFAFGGNDLTVGGTYFDTLLSFAGCDSIITLNLFVIPDSNLAISCPADVTVGNLDGNCNQFVFWNLPTITGGTPPVTLSSNISLNMFGFVILNVGSYTVTYTATDANGATASCSFNVAVVDTQAPVVNCPADVVVTTDSNNCSSVATWPTPLANDNCNVTSLTSNFNSGDPFPIGTTTVTYTAMDAAGNTGTCDFTVTVNSTPINLSAVVTDVACFGDATGAIDLTVSGGCPPYTFGWSNGATTEDLANLTAGVYTVIVTDGLGQTATLAVTVGTASQINTGFTTSLFNCGFNISCNGETDGFANAVVNGGTPPYTYSWSNGSTADNITNVGAGTYTVTVTDANGCVISDTVTLIEPPLLVGTIASTTDITCNGDSDGAVDLSVTGGCLPYSYSWSNGATTEDLTGVPAGTYDVTITDANGCTATASATLTEPPLLGTRTRVFELYNGQAISCFGAADARFGVNVQGGTAPYTFLWSNGGTTDRQTNQAAGTYYVTVTDANGCTAVDSAVVIEPDSICARTEIITQTIYNGADVTCNGDQNAWVDLILKGGTPNTGQHPCPYFTDWSTGATSEDLANVGAGTYTVTITDGNGCTTTTSVTVTEPDTLSATAIQLGDSCGTNTGSLDVTPAGGTAPYTFLWSNGAITEDLTNVPAGSYQLTITDVNGCTGTFDFSVVSLPLGYTGAITNVSCFGAADGAIDLTITCGNGPFTYDWSHGPTGPTVTGLSPGVYTVQVIDSATGSFLTQGFTVTEPTPIQNVSTVSDFNGFNVQCNGETNGFISVLTSGGTPPYSYLWSTGDSTAFLAGLGAGTYWLNTIDANGCTITDTFTLTEPPALFASSNVFGIVCSGTGSIGNINITPAGGILPYTYLWSNGQMGEDLLGVPAGTYTITVTDFNGCTVTETATIPNAAISVSLTASNDSCSSGQGVLAATVTPPGSYNYQFYQGTLTSGTGTAILIGSGTSSVLTGLTANTYFVVASTGTGSCFATAEATIADSCAPVSFNCFASSTNVSCQGGADGTASVTIVGGTPPYSIIWSNGATTPTTTGLSAGVYTVNVADTTGSLCVSQVVITEPASLIPTYIRSDYNGFNISCNGASDGFVSALITGGTPPYSFNWSNGSTTPIATNLSAGFTQVTITDANGCQLFNSLFMSEPSALSGSSAITATSCVGNNTLGSIDVSVAGGVLPYTYLWSNGATSQDLNNVTSGSYSLTVTDNNGCTTIINEIIQSLNPQVSLSNSNDSCNTAAGTITASVSGGGSFTYDWYRGSLATGTGSAALLQSGPSNMLDSLTADTYFVVVFSGTGTSCFTTAEAIIGNTCGSSPLTCGFTLSDYNGANISCNGVADGTIDVIVSGGTPPYAINWSDGGTGFNRTGLSAGVYFATVVDTFGNFCTQQFVLVEPAPLQNVFNRSDYNGFGISCNSATDGFISTLVTGGIPPYSYLWSTGDTTNLLTNIGQGTYSVTITDANGCTITGSLNLTSPSQMFSNAVPGFVRCLGQQTRGNINLSVVNGLLPYSFQWSNGQIVGSLTNVLSGSYTVTISDANGCTITDSATIQSLNPTVTLTVEDDSCSLGIGKITATVSPPSSYTYQWWQGSAATGTGSATLIGSGTMNMISGLSADTFFVVVNEVGSGTGTCLTVVEAVVGSIPCGTPPPLTISSDSVGSYGALGYGTSCFGFTDGTIDITVTGGQPPYSYIWNDGATTEDRVGLAAGNYSVTVIDNNSNLFVDNYTIIEATQITGSTQVICPGGMGNGDIAINASGGTPGYTYFWNTGSTADTLTNVADGTYSVTVTDANGCTAVFSAQANCNTIPIAPPMAFDPPEIEASENEEATIEAKGESGTKGASYSKTGPNDEDGDDQTPVIIADHNFDITAYPNPFKDEITIQYTLGDGQSNVNIVVINSIGQVVYHDQYLGDHHGENRKTINLAGLAKGVYYITITDGTFKETLKIIKQQ